MKNNCNKRFDSNFHYLFFLDHSCLVSASVAPEIVEWLRKLELKIRGEKGFKETFMSSCNCNDDTLLCIVVEQGIITKHTCIHV